jgi:3-keto-L-gulonate-6-phosphate decarboxylase
MDHALVVAEAAATAGIQFVEIGDPLIKSVGIDAITRVKLRVPQVTVVAEMMSADWGRDQVVLAAEAGADVVLLIGPATTASVSSAVEASRRFAVPLVLDVPDGRLSQTWVEAMQRIGIDGFAITTNIDVGVAGSSPLDHAAALRRWTRLPIAVSGGFETTDEAARRSDAWDVLVVGRSVTDAVNPTDAARQVAAITPRPSRRTQA